MHEVLFFMEFARYLLKQGYSQSQVTILVTYRAQLLELQKVISKNLCKIKLVLLISNFLLILYSNLFLVPSSNMVLL